MLHQVRSRLPEGARSRIEGFVAYTSPEWVTGAHALGLIFAGVMGLWWPLVAAPLCGLITASLVAESSGRFSALRRVLPKSASYNLVWRREAEQPLGALVVTAPLDTPRWRPEPPRWLGRPLQMVVFAAGLVTFLVTLRALAEPWGRPSQGLYTVALLVLASTVALGIMAHRRTPVMRDDASGAAALLELHRRVMEKPIPGLDVWLVFTGCSHAYQNGMHAFLAMRGVRLRQPLFVLTLDEPGAAPLAAVVSEGPLYAQHHRPTGPALVERLRWGGVDLPARDTARVTDARAALQWGYRALALTGGGGPSSPEHTQRAVDVAEALSRMYAEDVASVPELAPALEPVTETVDTEKVVVGR